MAEVCAISVLSSCRKSIDVYCPTHGWSNAATVLLSVITIMMMMICIQGESKESSPPTTFDIFAWAESFCIKFCSFFASLYPHMCTNFRLFISTFNVMALILSRPPIVFTVSSLDCSARNKNAEFQLNGNDVIGQWSRLDCRLS